MSRVRRASFAHVTFLIVSTICGFAEVQKQHDCKPTGPKTVSSQPCNQAKTADKSIGEQTAEGTKKAYHKTADGTEKVADKTADGTKKAYHKTADGTKKAGDKVEGKPE